MHYSLLFSYIFILEIILVLCFCIKSIRTVAITYGSIASKLSLPPEGVYLLFHFEYVLMNNGCLDESSQVSSTKVAVHITLVLLLSCVLLATVLENLSELTLFMCISIRYVGIVELDCKKTSPTSFQTA